MEQRKITKLSEGFNRDKREGWLAFSFLQWYAKHKVKNDSGCLGSAVSMGRDEWKPVTMRVAWVKLFSRDDFL
jgi:hypothetical protein